MAQVKKVCKADKCGKEFIGASASKFCSPECRKKGEGKVFVRETILLNEQRKTLHLPEPKQKEVIIPAAISTVKISDDKKPLVLLKSNSSTMIQDVKMLMSVSPTIEQVISNILTKHKYKDPKNCVSHIEDLLLFANG